MKQSLRRISVSCVLFTSNTPLTLLHSKYKNRKADQCYKQLTTNRDKIFPIETTNQCDERQWKCMLLKEINGYVNNFPSRKCNKNQLLNRKSKMNFISRAIRIECETKLKFTLFHTPSMGFSMLWKCVYAVCSTARMLFTI